MVVSEAGYDVTRLAWVLRDLPVELVGRVRSDRVMRLPKPPRMPGVNGRPPKHGPEFRFTKPETWPEPAITTVTSTTNYGKAEAQAWDRVHPRLTHRSSWLDHDGELPVVEGTLMRLKVEYLSKDREAPPVWLWSSKTGATPDDVDRFWQAFPRRFDDGLKHTADAGGSQPQAAAHAAAAAITVIMALTLPTSASSAYPAASSAEIGTAHTPHNEGEQPTADGSGPQWEPMADAVEVSWRRTGHNSPFSTSAAALEIHLVPIPSGSRIEVRKLAQLGDQVIRTGREDGFFTLSELLDTAADDQHALVTTAGRGQGATGLAVLRTGQRSAWQPLPHDAMGAVLDPVELPQQIARLLALLVRLPLPDPLSVALGIGIDPATMISEDTVSRFPRSTAQFPMRHDLLRVHPDESLTMKELHAKSDSVAEELAARLLPCLAPSF